MIEGEIENAIPLEKDILQNIDALLVEAFDEYQLNKDQPNTILNQDGKQI
jgi:hypothetical protein